MQRGAGVLLHISSLPTKEGIGTFGREAYDFVLLLQSLHFRYWQILPLNPTGFKDSPYQSFSSMAINPYFIDIRFLIEDGLLDKTDYIYQENETKVDYGFIYENKWKLLKKAYQNIDEKLLEEMKSFEKLHLYWLEDYALFMLLKEQHQQKAFYLWQENYAKYQKNALKAFKDTHLNAYYFYVFVQYEAFLQYQKLHRFAREKGISIIGDTPIYVSYDSADVWANPQQFLLDENHRVSLMAGVPPDYFSKTGQLWGNPLYDYAYQEKEHFSWWKRRFLHNLNLYEYIRIDHFRGFASFYAIPAEDDNALNGHWLEGPRTKLFDALQEEMDLSTLIVEDLGIITDDVIQLKNHYHFPGLKIVSFAFDQYDLNHPYLPQNFEKNCVGYLGSHDNAPVMAYLKENVIAKANIQKYYQKTENLHECLMQDLFSSSADIVILQMQDLLLEESRMNYPGLSSGNWTYRLKKDYQKHLEKEKIIRYIQQSHR